MGHVDTLMKKKVLYISANLLGRQVKVGDLATGSTGLGWHARWFVRTEEVDKLSPVTAIVPEVA